MRESKEESINRIIKLVDVVHHCSELFHSTTEVGLNSAFEQFAVRMYRQMDQFEFELRTELTRLAAAQRTNSPAETEENLLQALELALLTYLHALGCPLPPHARAMLTRQSEEIRKAHEEFLSLNRAA